MNAPVPGIDGAGSLPPGWRRVRLEDCVTIYDHLRVPLNQQERAARPGPYPYYGANGQVDTVGEFLFDGDFVLIAEDGGYFDEPHRGVAYRAIGKFWVNNHAHIVQSNGAIEHSLLIAQLNSLDWSPFVGGTTRAKLTQAALRGIPLLVPPLAEQRRLVGKIEQLSSRSRSAREALSALPALSGQLRQATLAAAFRGDLTTDWRAKHPDVEPAAKLLERIRAERRRRWEEVELAKLTAKGKPPTDDRWKDKYQEPEVASPEDVPILPVGWVWATFDELTENFDGRRVPLNLEQRAGRQGSYPYYGASGVIDSVDDYLFDGDYLLIAEDGANLLSRSTPIAFIASGKFWVNNHAHVVQVVAPRLTNHVASFLNGMNLQQHVTGSAQPKLTQKSLNRILIPLAPEEEAARIGRILETMESRLAGVQIAHQEGLERLKALEQTILAKAFRGELVPQDPNDEPASVLLERLRAEAAAEPARKAARRSRKTDAEPVPDEPAPSSDTAPAGDKPARRSRRNSADTDAPLPPASAEPPAARPARVAATDDPPARAAEQAALAFPADATPFLDLPADAQAELVHAVLLGEGPLAREDAVRRAAEHLRDQGRAQFQRLRSDGPLATALDHAISLALRRGRIDRPDRGTVRAVARTPADIPPALWRRAILTAQQTAPDADPDTLVRTAATWLQTQVGLEFQRLRTGGHIDTALREVLDARPTQD